MKYAIKYTKNLYYFLEIGSKILRRLCYVCENFNAFIS